MMAQALTTTNDLWAATTAPDTAREISGGAARAPSLRQRVRERISRLLDRLDERWDDDNSLAGRWSGTCWFTYEHFAPNTHAPRSPR